ncbi:hypothetical protein Hanom_Chr05g00449941 [Helianthus anomalus]
MTDPSLCRELLKCAFTPAEVDLLRASGGENLYLQLTIHLVGVVATCNVILHNWYSLAQKEEEYQCFKT